MQNKIMFKNEDSCIAIKDDKMYILSTRYKDISSRALTVMSGFQIELGRDINDIITALKETRVPVIIKEVISNGDKSHYQIIRMHTGKVDDKLVATLLCNNGIIHSISFNRALIESLFETVSIATNKNLSFTLIGTNSFCSISAKST